MTTSMKTLMILMLAAAALALGACGGGETEGDNGDSGATPEAAQPAGDSSQPEETEEVGLTVRDDTADAAMETYLEGIKHGKLDVAIAVLVPDAPGTEKLYQMKEGWEKAAAEGAPIAMAQAVLAGEIGALTFEKISDDGAFATFQFSKPTSDETWDIQAIKTPEGWRITPPESGLPQN